jgi:hypothetical protein
MTSINLDLPEIPHGHGLSFKKGIADSLLGSSDHEGTTHETHAASYQRGIEVGKTLKQEIARLVSGQADR